MSYTSLHRAVDARPGLITAAMVADAVELHVIESEDLDWKQDTDDLKDNREIAKDFAALANASGGVIVVGVAEDGSDRADEVSGVDEARARDLVRKFREVAASRVRPFIPALQVYRLPAAHDPSRHIVVVDVPRSPEVPHLVLWDKETMRYPRRLGTDTVWLGETDLEAAYNRRFLTRQESAMQLRTLNADLRSHLVDAANRVWLLVTAQCSVPADQDAMLPVNPGQPDAHLRAIYEGLPAGESLLRQQLRSFMPRMGLRRAVFSSPGTYRGKSAGAHLELHLDGTFAGALSSTSASEIPGSRLLTQLALETGIRDLMVVAAKHAHHRGGSGTLQILADIYSPYAVTLGEHGTPRDEPLDESVSLVQTTAVSAQAPVDDLAVNDDVLAAVTKQVLLDLTHQFAVSTLLFR